MLWAFREPVRDWASFKKAPFTSPEKKTIIHMINFLYYKLAFEIGSTLKNNWSSSSFSIKMFFSGDMINYRSKRGQFFVIFTTSSGKKTIHLKTTRTTILFLKINIVPSFLICTKLCEGFGCLPLNGMPGPGSGRKRTCLVAKMKANEARMIPSRQPITARTRAQRTEQSPTM